MWLCCSQPLSKINFSSRPQKNAACRAPIIIIVVAWTIAVRNTARQVVSSCINYYRCKPCTINTIVNLLTNSRIQPALPFSKVTLCFEGRFFIKGKRARWWKLIKSYICLLLVTKLSTEFFITCLQRFTSSRGKSRHIFSIQWDKFSWTLTQLNKMHSFLITGQRDVMSAISQDNIPWQFIPPHAPTLGICRKWLLGLLNIIYLEY